MGENERIARKLFEICDSTELILSFAGRIRKEEFLSNRDYQNCVLTPFIVLGEASYRLKKEYPDFVKQYPIIPWQDMADFRNIIAHDYYRVLPQVVWNTIQTNLPELKIHLESLLKEEPIIKELLITELQLQNINIPWIEATRDEQSPSVIPS